MTRFEKTCLPRTIAELPAILDIFYWFTGIANATSTPIEWEGGGRPVATKWWAKATSRLKTAKWHPFVPFSPLHFTQSS